MCNENNNDDQQPEVVEENPLLKEFSDILKFLKTLYGIAAAVPLIVPILTLFGAIKLSFLCPDPMISQGKIAAVSAFVDIFFIVTVLYFKGKVKKSSVGALYTFAAVMFVLCLTGFFILLFLLSDSAQSGDPCRPSYFIYVTAVYTLMLVTATMSFMLFGLKLYFISKKGEKK